MSTKESLHRAFERPSVRVQHDPGSACDWLYMNADHDAGARPCFRREQMHEMWSLLSALSRPGLPGVPLRHVVLASDAPHAFSLGGDLALFARLIRDRDRDALLDYATHCVDGVHLLSNGGNGHIRTIALIQGDALGGGMEIALACHVIVAEEGTEMGLPEVLFGLFPGMGAYSFLCRRVPASVAERLILEGRIFPVEELHRMGIVDVLAPRGQGQRVVREIVQREQRAPQAHIALGRIRSYANAVTHAELMDVTRTWVEAALALEERSLRMMDRIVKAQLRRFQR